MDGGIREYAKMAAAAAKAERGALGQTLRKTRAKAKAKIPEPEWGPGEENYFAAAVLMQIAGLKRTRQEKLLPKASRKNVSAETAAVTACNASSAGSPSLASAPAGHASATKLETAPAGGAVKSRRRTKPNLQVSKWAPREDDLMAADVLLHIAGVKKLTKEDSSKKEAAKVSAVAACRAISATPAPPASAPAGDTSASHFQVEPVFAPAPLDFRFPQAFAPALAPAAPAPTPQTEAFPYLQIAAQTSIPQLRALLYARALAPHLFTEQPASAVAPAGHGPSFYHQLPPLASAATSAPAFQTPFTMPGGTYVSPHPLAPTYTWPGTSFVGSNWTTFGGSAQPILPTGGNNADVNASSPAAQLMSPATFHDRQRLLAVQAAGGLGAVRGDPGTPYGRRQKRRRGGRRP